MDKNILIHLLLYLNILSLIIGYLIGKIQNSLITNNLFDAKNSKKNKQNIIQPNNITIDDKKVIVDIDTKGLEKKYESLGEVSQVESNIGNSINKLKNLKR